MINLYWNVGAYISNRISHSNWGDKTVDELADYIQKNRSELKGFNRRGLYRMKQFYEIYQGTVLIPQTQENQHGDKIGSPVETQLQVPENQVSKIVSPVETQFKMRNIRGSILTKVSWAHHLILLSRTQTEEEREFYLKLSIQEKYSKRELERQINTGVFERVMIGNTQIPDRVKEIHPIVANSFKDVYVFEFLNLPEPHKECDLQKALIAQMKNFILELGKEFLFVGQEYKLQVGNNDFYIDLLFFHRSLQCLVVFELKADSFRPEQLGQLNFYLEALDRDVKKANENPSIGILLCKDKDHEVVEYAMSRSLSPTMVSEYKMQLPDKKILQQKLHELFEDHNEG